jgi:hypothetical protein
MGIKNKMIYLHEEKKDETDKKEESDKVKS